MRLFLTFYFCIFSCYFKAVSCIYEANCSNLLMGQYLCIGPDIDPKTQQPKNCQKNNLAKVTCVTANGIICKPGTGINETTFEKDFDCRFTNGYSFETALLLSLFLGMFGIDRFYLGYPAIGLAKLCTLGFMFLGQLVDIILIALQVVGPSDGSHYVINYFGPRLTILKRDNETYVMPQDDW
ncbi:TM2 domain-containing protein CG10795-like [Uloborus diversus]|uniref:TM2 domain-containing protein CG10795-like n=1 Tax=Uloborus diversus TaxID=327109 RepID=UPI00240980E0|nr:TM2 domain-containing protein CG10795-like [Uloborus diversus]XP_054721012.1 TM2 domain-containing protein CG10795-like [Uloborus diversus]